MIDPTTTERDDVERLADAFLASFRAGDSPSIDEFVDQYPELADERRDLLKAVVLLEQNVAPRTCESPRVLDTATEGLPHRIGDFQIVREIGRGGMGVVYEAVQQSLGRQVALKVLSLPGMINPSHLERFRREARAAARLQHSHIVPVFDFGAHDGTYYYAMQFVPGQSLNLVVDSLRLSRSAVERSSVTAMPIMSSASDTSARAHDHPAAAPSPDTCVAALSDTEFSTSAGRRQFYRNVARVGLQAAEALAYAHAEGILHRDIKPSNLLLDTKGNIWITDFGLARTEGDEELTHTGDFVGTLRYTSPERLEGRSDRRSDIYGLGVTLYELLTLQPFFANRSRAELLRRIANDTPPAPRRIDASIPVDLETIVLKAVAKEPAARYHRAEQMADDLRRFLADRPILARRSTVVERFGRWCRRNPVIASLATAVAASLMLAVGILAFSNAQIRREAAAKEEAYGQVWFYRGMYGVDGEAEESLRSFDKAIRLAPNNPEILWMRGFTLGGWGRWDDAIADMTQARSLLRGPQLNSSAGCDWFIAIAHLANGNRAAYQAACREALDKIPTEPKLSERRTLLWMCIVTPYAVEGSARLADFVANVLPPNEEAPTSDQLLCAGAALFRAGNLTEARQHLEQTIHQIADGKRTVDPMSEIFANLFLAMTYSRLGLAEKAQAQLVQADDLTKHIQPQCWVDQVQLQLLTEEARATIDGPQTALSQDG